LQSIHELNSRACVGCMHSLSAVVVWRLRLPPISVLASRTCGFCCSGCGCSTSDRRALLGLLLLRERLLLLLLAGTRRGAPSGPTLLLLVRARHMLCCMLHGRDSMAADLCDWLQRVERADTG
jgi:hypothetical protein